MGRKVEPAWVDEARELREQGYSWSQIANALGVEKAQVSLWVDPLGQRKLAQHRKKLRGRKRRSPWYEGPAPRCVVCGKQGTRHHAVFEQHILDRGGDPSDIRNQFGMCQKHHFEFHNRTLEVYVSMMPASVFEFAVELMGEAAPGYLRRRYTVDDEALFERLLNEAQEKINGPDKQPA